MMETEKLEILIQFVLRNKVLVSLIAFALFQIYFWITRTFYTGPRNALSKMNPQIKSPKKDFVYLFQFPVSEGKNGSPFCMKLESYLQLNGIPYEDVKGEHYNKNPKHKLPVIELNGEVIADTTFIISHLQSKFGNPDSTLSATDVAIATAYQRLVEDHLVVAIGYFRWIPSNSWDQWKDQAFKSIPFLIRPFITSMIRKGAMDTMWAQGLGRNTAQEILKLAQDDLEAISTFLGTKKFFFGDQPHTIDCILYGALFSVLQVRIEGSPLLKLTLKYPNLVQYTERMRATIERKIEKAD